MPLLEVKNLHAEVDGKKILNGLDLTVEKGAMQLLHAWRQATIDLAEHDRAAAGVLDHAWLEVIRSEVDETAHRPRVTDDRLDDELVQPVLRRGDDLHTKS